MEGLMGYLCRSLVVLIAISLLPACGGIEDKDGNSLQVGQQYRMTDDGLERVPHLVDKSGSPLVMGKEYAMTNQGLELVTYLKDKNGNRVEVGNEYVMTGDGLRLTVSRGIKGTIQDHSGKALPDVEVIVGGTDYKTSTKQDGSFTLPFIEGYVRLDFKIPGLPEWCSLEAMENPLISRERFPDGWDTGVIKLPCSFVESKGDKSVWTSANGSFVDNGDGTFSDVKNGLMWEGEVKTRRVSWNSADEYAAGLDLAGYSDWRLPTPEELEALHEAGTACVLIEPTMIKGALSLWTSEHVDDSALVYDICSGNTRKSRGLDEGMNVNASALAVRSLN